MTAHCPACGPVERISPDHRHCFECGAKLQALPAPVLRNGWLLVPDPHPCAGQHGQSEHLWTLVDLADETPSDFAGACERADELGRGPWEDLPVGDPLWCDARVCPDRIAPGRSLYHRETGDVLHDLCAAGMR